MLLRIRGNVSSEVVQMSAVRDMFLFSTSSTKYDVAVVLVSSVFEIFSDNLISYIWLCLSACAHKERHFYCATRMHSADNAVARCLSLRLSVTRRHSV